MSTSQPTPGPTPGPRPSTPSAPDQSSPRPAPPAGQASQAHDPPPELPDQEALEAMTIREHVTLFEELHRTLADRLDDTGS